jgi:DNA-binding GntR family transcriptional regulator
MSGADEGYWVLGTRRGAPTPSRTGTAVEDVRNRLREAILAGELRPGEAVTSVQAAERFGVSRTPAREALRMLQEEGFLAGESNQRLRVVEWSPDELEAVFAERILLTVLSTRLTVPSLTDGDLARMDELAGRMTRARDAGDSNAWREADMAFHSMHLHRASETLREDLSRLYERATMFRSIWLRNRDQTLQFATDDHPVILEACRKHDAERAALAAARHLTRVAMTLMVEMAPGHDAVAVREALRMAGSEPQDISPAQRRPSRTKSSLSSSA